MEQAQEYRRLRAPEQDGETFVAPPWQELSAIVAANRDRLQAEKLTLGDQRLGDLAASARRSLLAAAKRYTGQYAKLPDESSATAHDALPTILIAGHQPQIFHPGVWYKHFAVAMLAREIGAYALNLVIDSDLCRAASIRVPAGGIDSPSVESIAFDRPAEDCPFEERKISDVATFRSFADRASACIRPLVANPVVDEYWSHVLNRQPEEGNLGRCLSQGRHNLENEWKNAHRLTGSESLELPQSLVCELPEFHRFTAHLLVNLPRFVAAHNTALHAYRRAHRLRNRAHPVPDLADGRDSARDGWCEAPFWIWRTENPFRKALFVRQQGSEIVLSDRDEFVLRLHSGKHLAGLGEALGELAVKGIKLRTRALTTTLFARLLLSDLFIHGIGGAKYDDVTDHIVRTFYGINPPRIAVVSATLRLPISHPSATEERRRRLWRIQRDMRFNPQRFLSEIDAPAEKVSSLKSLLQEKQRLIRVKNTPTNARQRHEAICAVNQSLQPFLAKKQAELQSQLRECDRFRRAGAILDSREYAFCLFPKRQLESLLLDSWRRLP